MEPRKLFLSIPDLNNSNTSLPDSFRIFAFGTTDTTKGEYKFDSESASAVMTAFNDYGNRLTMDYEHQALQDPPIKAPAAASYLLDLRADGLYATDIKWTPIAADHLKNKEYLYFSPAFLTDDDGRPSRLLNVALTNIPATKSMQPLVAAKHTEEKAMKTLLTALSLKESASEAEALSVVNKLSEDRKQLLASIEKESVAEAIGVIAGWKRAQGELVSLRAEVAKRDALQKERDFDAIIDQASREGKIPPADESAERKFILSIRNREDGLEMLKGYVSTLRPIVPVGSVQSGSVEPAAAAATVTLTSEEKKIAKSMNIPLEKLLENKARRLKMVRENGDVGHNDKEDAA